MSFRRQILLLSFTFTFTALHAQSGFKSEGIASYYADKFNGRKTASGEIFRNSKLTAAHKKLPFGTILKVTNLKNGKSVIVKVNDRGPYAHGRIIDLSKAAAKKIDMLDDGLANVRLEIVEQEKVVEMSGRDSESKIENDKVSVISIWGTEREVTGYGVQLASFKDKELAIKFGKEMYDKGVELPLIKIHKEKGVEYYRVMAGVLEKPVDAEAYLKKLKKKGFKGFVKSYE